MHSSSLSARKCGLFVVLLVLCLLGLVRAQGSTNPINIAVLTLDPFSWPGGFNNYTGPLKGDSASLIQSYKLWTQIVNSKGGLETPSGVRPINLTIVQIGDNRASHIAATTQAVTSGQYEYYFGPFSSAWTINVATAMLPYNNTFLMAGHAAATSVFQCEDVPEQRPPCTRAFTPRFENVYGVCPVAEQFLEAPINLIALRGAKRVVAWYQNEDFCKGVANGGIVTALSGGMEMIWKEPKAMALNATQADYDALAAQMKAADPDLVISGSRVGSCVMLLKAIKKVNWTPRALLTSLCAGDPTLPTVLAANGLELADARFIIDEAVWDPRLKGPEFEDASYMHFYYPGAGPTSAIQFLGNYTAYTNGTLIDLNSAPLAMGMAYAFEAALARATSDTVASVRSSFNTILINSFFGKIGFNGFGQNDAKALANTQRNRTDGVDLVSPLSAATASIIYPMPTWSDRIFAPKWYNRPSEIAILTVALVMAVFSILMGILTFVFRNTKGIVASSPLFLYLMLAGSLLIYAGVITWALHTTTFLCMLHWWLLGLGFTVMYGALLVKVWRISRIFNGKDLSLIRITNSELIIFISVALAIEVILLIIWSAAGRSVAERRSKDVNRPRLDYVTCTTTTVGIVILAIMAAYASLFIVAGVWLSIKTWKIKYSVYNESRSVAFSMYNLFFFLALAIIAQFVLNSSKGENREAQFVVRSVMILLGAWLPIAVLFLPKFMRKGHLTTDNVGSNNSHTKGTNGTNGTTGGGKTSTGGLRSISDDGGSYEMGESNKMQKTIDRLEQKNERLKAEVKRLRKELDAKAPSTPKGIGAAH